MDRRAFLMSVAGLGVTPQPQSGASGPADPPPAAPLASSSLAVDPAVELVKGEVRARAIAAGFDPKRVNAILDPLTPDPRVLTLQSRQPELSRPIGDYVQGAVTAARIAKGQQRLAELPGLGEVAARYGVQSEILVAVWGMETSFGAIQGDYDVFRSLFTQAVQGRRRDWAEGQMIAAFRIVFEGHASASQLKGSWAGAMGQTQFMPEDYLNFAVDGDGDGRRDIWGSPLDALASTANFLSRKAAWRASERWAREVILPSGFDYGLSEGPKQAWAAWQALGVRMADGGPVSAADAGEVAQLLLPQGWRGPAFLAWPNHFAIRVYNNSVAYALAVGLIADGVAGRPPLVTPWPKDPPLHLEDRIAAQASLKALGFDPGAQDGAFGLNTRAATRSWQRARGLPADGYLTLDLIQRLRSEAAQAAPPAAPLPG